MSILPDDKVKNESEGENEPVSSDKFRSYDIYTGKFEDEIPLKSAEHENAVHGDNETTAKSEDSVQKSGSKEMLPSERTRPKADRTAPSSGREISSSGKATPPARRAAPSAGLTRPAATGTEVSESDALKPAAPRPSASGSGLPAKRSGASGAVTPKSAAQLPDAPKSGASGAVTPKSAAPLPAAPKSAAQLPAAPKPSTSRSGLPAPRSGASESGLPAQRPAQKPVQQRPAQRPVQQRPAQQRQTSPRHAASKPITSGDRDYKTDKHRNAIDAEFTESGARPRDAYEDDVRRYELEGEPVTRRGTRKAGDDEELDTGPDDFEVKFDFEGKYMDVPEERPLRWRRERRTGCVGGILYAAFVICISILLASIAWLAAADVLGFGAADEEVNMIIPKDFILEDVVDLLFDAGLIRYKFLFRIYAGYSSAEEKITAGAYVLNKNFDYRALVHGMTTRGGARVEVPVQIPEGYTLLQMFALLEEKQVCSADELWRSATWYNYTQRILPPILRGNKLRLEGYLFPDTYNFYIGSTPEQAISKMLSEFNNKFTEQFAERAEFMGYTIHEIITIASMIEREAGNDEERPYIASVIYNRLNSKDFPMLQIDATIYYAIAGTGKPFSTDFDSPYNTYTHEGLPPGPIANPGLASIRAALYPASTKNYYYALNNSGSHNFFDTYEKHRAFVQSDEFGGR